MSLLPDDLITDAVARRDYLANRPAGTTAAWRSRRVIPFYKIGRAIFYSRRELLAWLSAHHVPARERADDELADARAELQRRRDERST